MMVYGSKYYEESFFTIGIGRCPVNRNIPTKMYVETFEMMCSKFRAAALSGEKPRWNQKSIVTKTCMDCKVGKKVKNGEPYDPPENLILERKRPKLKRRKDGK